MWTRDGLSHSGGIRPGATNCADFKSQKAADAASSQAPMPELFCTRGVNGAASSKKQGIRQRKSCTIPTKVCSSVIVRGLGQLEITFVCSGWTRIQRDWKSCQETLFRTSGSPTSVETHRVYVLEAAVEPNGHARDAPRMYDCRWVYCRCAPPESDRCSLGKRS